MCLLAHRNIVCVDERVWVCKAEKINDSLVKKILPFLLIGQMLVLYLPGCKFGKVKITNPIAKGYYADPGIIYDKGSYYIYATKDPWGGNDLAVLETPDFVHFTSRKINWPTKEACTSPTSNKNMVW